MYILLFLFSGEPVFKSIQLLAYSSKMSSFLYIGSGTFMNIPLAQVGLTEISHK